MSMAWVMMAGTLERGGVYHNMIFNGWCQMQILDLGQNSKLETINLLFQDKN